MGFCTGCGTPLEGARFCTNCGTRAEGGGPSHQVCPRCGNEQRPGDKFCLSCGAPVEDGHETLPTPETGTVAASPSQQRFVEPTTADSACPYCAAPIAPDDVFCIACGTPLGETSPAEKRKRAWLIPVAAVAAVVLLGAGAWLVLADSGDDQPSGTDAPALGDTDEEPSDDSPETTSAPTTTATQTTTSSTTTSTTTTTTSTTVPPSVLLDPVSAVASKTRPAVSRLRCGGSNSFEATNIIDGDFNTGWGAESGDGVGEWIRIDLGTRVRLTQIGLTPGYLRVAPRSDQDCAEVLAFDYNRFVVAVEYQFDDGSTVRHDFLQEPSMQFEELDVSTQYVTITILSTRRTVDNDTIISDVQFFGYVE